MGKIALLFSGQGSQYIGMGKEIYTKYKVAKDTFEEANEALGFDLAKHCFEGEESWINQTKNTQPALLSLEVAMFRVYMQEFGIVPACCMGHSLGEISALTCSGAINFEDAIKLVAKRGEFMQQEAENSSGKMLVVMNADLKTIEHECEIISNGEYIVNISNYNSPTQIVLSGHEQALNIIFEKLKAMNGVRVKELNVKAPFHCELMNPAAKKFREELEKYKINDLNYPVISNVDGKPYANKNFIKDTLAKQIISPVKWIDSIDYLEKMGVDTALEIGPKTILRNLLIRYENGIKSLSYDIKEDRIKFKNWVDSLTAEDFKHTLTNICLREAVCTKNNNYNLVQYEEGVVKPYKKLKEIIYNIENKGYTPTILEMKQSIEILKTIFNTKCVDENEQKDIFNDILNETKTKDFLISYMIEKGYM